MTRPVGACPTCEDTAFLLEYIEPEAIAKRLGWNLHNLAMHLRRHGSPAAAALEAARKRAAS